MKLKIKKRRKLIILFISIYLLIGFFYGMWGEMRLAVKYEHARDYREAAILAFSNLSIYPRAILSSPIWPVGFFGCLYLAGTPFCPASPQ